MKTKHQVLLILCLAATIEAFSQAEIQNPVFPFWKIKGNSGTTVGTNFLDTTDAQALMFKVNNQRAGYIDYATPFSTGFGYQTLNANTGINNSAFGYQALLSNTTANSSTAVGYFSLKSNTTGNFNTAVGVSTLQSNVSGANNSAVGYQSLVTNSTGYSNTAIGFFAMRLNTTGYENAAVGVNALKSNTTGYMNAALGNGSLEFATTAFGNTAIGFKSLQTNTTGQNNTAVGYLSMNQTTGNSNTAVGSNALGGNTSGGNNTAFGMYALQTDTTGSNNTALGYGADVASGTLTNATAIGYNAKVGASNSLVLGGTGVDAVNVGIGTTVPDRPLTVQGTGVNNELISLKNSAATTKYHWNLSGGGLNLAETGVADGRIYVKDATGNVGIGTTTPANKLDVEGGLAVGTAFSGTSAAPANGAIIEGNVGIGIDATSPTELVLLRKDGFDNYLRVDAGGSDAFSSGIKLYEPGLNYGWNMRFNPVSTSDDLFFEFNNSGTITSVMKLDNLGNVGIGTTAPLDILHIVGHLRMVDGSQGIGKIMVSDANGTGTWTSVSTTISSTAWTLTGNSGTVAGTNFIGTTDAVDLVVKTNNTERIRVLSAGNVGIGTTAPGTALHIDNSANSGPQITLSAPSGGTPGIVFRPFQTPAQWSNPAQALISATDNNYSADIHFWTKTPGALANALTERVTILNNGNLGVGIAAPTSTLHVNGAFATTVKTAQVAGTNNPDNTAAVWIYSSGSGTITLPGAGTCSGRRYVIVNQTGASVTTSSYINLATTAVTALANNTSMEVISDATNWRQIK